MCSSQALARLKNYATILEDTKKKNSPIVVSRTPSARKGLIEMKKTIASLMLILFSFSTFAIGKAIINDNKVNIRDFPSIERGKVIFQATKGSEAYIYSALIESEKIGGDNNRWYYVGISGTQINGWVWGKYLSQVESNSIYRITIKRLYRNDYGDELIKSLFGGKIGDQYDLVKLSKYKIIDSKDTSFWQMKESGFTKLNTYETEYGNLYAFVNLVSQRWIFNKVVIVKNGYFKQVELGQDVDGLAKILGNDFETTNNEISYSENEEWDSYVYKVQIVDGKIKELEIAKYWD